MFKSKAYIISIAGLVFLAGLMYYVNSNQNDWSKTFFNFEKKPYDTYVLYKLLPAIFPSEGVEEVNKDLVTFCQENEGKTSVNVIDIGFSQYLYQDELKDVLDFISNGNHVFLSSLDFSYSLLDSLGLYHSGSYNYYENDTMYGVDENFYLTYVDEIYKIKNNKKISNSILEHAADSASDFDIFGYKENNYKKTEETNFIVINIGKGKIYLFASPLYFTNYAILKDNVSEYVASVFSAMPDQKTYWIEDNRISSVMGESPMRFVLNNTYLKWAWYTLLLGGLVLAIAALKRKQNPIPIINPLKNNSLDFVKTVGRLYFSKKNNIDLAHKKGIYFAEKFKSQYGITLQIEDKNVTQLVMSKTGADLDKAKELINFLLQANALIYFSDKDLFEFHQIITYFYHKMNE